ncbi:MAG TPA: trehalose-6-phosphate synthase [Mycobacteriales bacterium]|nr:trehalose-6-phosphate synthase [Mycobacteriales bacterium]
MAPPSPFELPTVLLSHRGPVSFTRTGGGRKAAPGAGGLVTALTGLCAQLADVVWIFVGSDGEDVQVAREAPGGVRELMLAPEPHLVADPPADAAEASIRIRLVEVPPEVHEPFYGIVANPLLWFIQHRLYGLAVEPSLGRAEHRAFEEGYVEANRLAADAVIDQVRRAGGRACVFVHDYHFYLVGELVRRACPDVLLSHFVHIPWPGPENWRVLPPALREPILRGLLGCDVVAFHTASDARSFLLCVQELLGLPVDLDSSCVTVEGRTVRARSYPISIDVAALEQIAASDAANAHLAELDRELGSGWLLLRVDRTDPSKNIVRGFEAFSLLLDEHPELAGGVVFLALLQPSRQDVEEYATYLAQVTDAAAAVNTRHGTGSWQPVDLRLVSDMPLAAAAYRRCDVLVVNAVADGMNLVAKEAVVVNEHDMVLALSEATGAHGELGRYAVTLHPFDLAQQADALHEALTMPLDLRRARRREAARVVRRNDVGRWLRAQLHDLAGLAPEAEETGGGAGPG